MSHHHYAAIVCGKDAVGARRERERGREGGREREREREFIRKQSPWRVVYNGDAPMLRRRLAAETNFSFLTRHMLVCLGHKLPNSDYKLPISGPTYA